MHESKYLFRLQKGQQILEKANENQIDKCQNRERRPIKTNVSFADNFSSDQLEIFL